MVEVDPQVGRTRVDLSLSTTTHSDTRLTLQNSLNYGLHAPAASRNPSPIAACCRALLTASPLAFMLLAVDAPHDIKRNSRSSSFAVYTLGKTPPPGAAGCRPRTSGQVER
jgi:hypothetical protein